MRGDGARRARLGFWTASALAGPEYGGGRVRCCGLVPALISMRAGVGSQVLPCASSWLMWRHRRALERMDARELA